MGRSVTPTYRIEFDGVVNVTRRERVSHTPSAYRGLPSNRGLVEYVRSFEESTLPGGVNEHLGITRVGAANVIRQSTGKVVASYEAPLFAAVV